MGTCVWMCVDTLCVDVVWYIVCGCEDVVWVHCACVDVVWVHCGVDILCVDMCVGELCVDVVWVHVCGCGVDTLWCGSPYLSIIIMFIMCSCTGFMETVT